MRRFLLTLALLSAIALPAFAQDPMETRAAQPGQPGLDPRLRAMPTAAPVAEGAEVAEIEANSADGVEPIAAPEGEPAAAAPEVIEAADLVPATNVAEHQHAVEEEHGAHASELETLRIHGIADLFSIPSDLPEEIREERSHLRNQLLAAFVNFGLLLTILIVKVRPMITASLIERRASIAKDIEEAARLKAEAEAKHAEYKKRLAEIDVEIADIREKMVAAGKTEAERIVSEAQAKAERSRRETEFLIEQRMKSLRDELTKETVVGAIAAAELLLKEKTSSEDQSRLSRDYLAALGKSSTQTGGRA